MVNVLDRLIGYLAPKAAARRELARARAESLKTITALYEGAARTNRTAWKRVGGGSSANSEIFRSLPRLRDVSRDLVRNNPYASNVVAQIPANVVGAGIIPSILTARPAVRLKAAIKGLIEDHLETTAIDFDGRLNLYGLQNLAMRTIVESGEVLVVRYIPPARLKLPVPLQLRVLEPDFLDPFHSGQEPNGNVSWEGIEFDPQGRRVAYWLYDEHPGGGLSWKMPASRRVAAEDVIHTFRVDRPGQYRGVPWGAPVMMTLNDLADYEDAELLRQKIAACFSVFVTGDDKRGLGQTVQQGATTVAGTAVETVEPGMILRLPAGSDVKFGMPPTVMAYADFVRAGARRVAIGYGVPYEVATGDLSQVTFISGRLGMIGFNRNVDQWRWQMLIPHVCAGASRWFLEAAGIALNQDLAGKVRLAWSPPRREMVSPKDEIPPIVAAVRGGLTSRSEAVRSSGYDAEELELEIAAENERADALGLRFDSDGRNPTATRGTEQISPPEIAGEDNAPAPDPNGGNAGSGKP